MDPIIADKMYTIAYYLKELNSQNKVKAYRKNEYGYAKVVNIKKGCSIWVHHTLENTLIIDLLISPAARKNYGELCQAAVRQFGGFFDKSPLQSQWSHADKPGVIHDRYAVDFTSERNSEIFNTLNAIQSFYGKKS